MAGRVLAADGAHVDHVGARLAYAPVPARQQAVRPRALHAHGVFVVRAARIRRRPRRATLAERQLEPALDVALLPLEGLDLAPQVADELARLVLLLLPPRLLRQALLRLLQLLRRRRLPA